MAELKNTYSWSFSAGHDFDECRRKRYWSKYAMWGGWDRRADPVSRTAYRLNKMDSRHTLRGQAAEEAVMWVFREQQQGRTRSVEEAYQQVARPMLNQAWKDSRGRDWREDPKRRTCLHEHYYPKLQTPGTENWPPEVAEQVKTCIGNFIESVLPRIADVTPAMEIPVGHVSAGGDPESFEYHGIRIYAIPDFVYVRDTAWHIHDWKAGRPRDSHLEQLRVYGLWAVTKHGVPVDRITVHAEYLLTGEERVLTLGAADLEQAHERIGSSVADMTEYLEACDRSQNKALPRDHWELASNPRACLRCNFYELCEAELRESGMI